jgi:hypothetical protein
LKSWQPWSKSMWETGRTGSFRLYVTGRDPGTELTIWKKENRSLSAQMPTTPTQTLPGSLAPGGPPAQIPPTSRLTHRGLFRTTDAVFRAFNATNPNLTQDCWLRLNPEPPYYVGIGVDAILGSEEQDIQNRTQTEITKSKSVCP